MLINVNRCLRATDRVIDAQVIFQRAGYGLTTISFINTLWRTSLAERYVVLRPMRRQFYYNYSTRPRDSTSRKRTDGKTGSSIQSPGFTGYPRVTLDKARLNARLQRSYPVILNRQTRRMVVVTIRSITRINARTGTPDLPEARIPTR